MKVNYNKVLRWFFLGEAVIAVILYFMHQNLEYRIVQLTALVSFFLQMYGVFADDKKKEIKQDTGEI